MAQSSPHFGRQNRSRVAAAFSLSNSFEASDDSPSSSSRSLPPPKSDRSELKVALQEVRRESAEQGAKALAILEVKDGVIERLERELDANRRASQEESNAAQKTLLLVEESEISFEMKAHQMREQLEAQCHDSNQEVAQVKQQLELLSCARAQAEADAVLAGKDLQMMRERSAAAERRIASLQEEASRHSGAIQKVRVLTEELEQARADVRRHAIVDQTRPSDEDVVRLEQALLQSQRDLASAERELHEVRRTELERGGMEASEQHLLTVLNRELSAARANAQQNESQFNDAAHRSISVKSSDNVRISRLEDEVERLQGVARNSRGSQTANDGFTGWLEDSLRIHDAALSDLIVSIRREASSGNWGLGRSSTQISEQSELHRLRCELQCLQEQHRQGNAKGHACAERLQDFEERHKVVLQEHENVASELAVERSRSAGVLAEHEKAISLVEERAAQESQEHATQKQVIDLQLRERQEQLRAACRSLEASSGPHAGARLGELTGRVLMLMRSEHALHRRFTQAQSEAERALSAQTSLAITLKSTAKKVATLEAGNAMLVSIDQQRFKEYESLKAKHHNSTEEILASEQKLRHAQRSLRQHSENSEAWCQRLVDLHDAHVEQLSHERSTSEEKHQRLVQQIEQPIPMVAAESVLRSLREIVEAGTLRRGSRKTSVDVSEGIAEAFALALQQLSRLERRSVLAEAEGTILREQSHVSAKVEAELLRDVNLLHQEVFRLRFPGTQQLTSAMEELAGHSGKKSDSESITKRYDELAVTSAELVAELRAARDENVSLAMQLQHRESAEASRERLEMEVGEQKVLDRHSEWRNELVSYCLAISDNGDNEVVERELGLELATKELAVRLEDLQLQNDSIALQNASLRARLDASREEHETKDSSLGEWMETFFERREQCDSSSKLAKNELHEMRLEMSAAISQADIQRQKCEELIIQSQRKRAFEELDEQVTDPTPQSLVAGVHRDVGAMASTLDDGQGERECILQSLIENLAKTCEGLRQKHDSAPSSSKDSLRCVGGSQQVVYVDEPRTKDHASKSALWARNSGPQQRAVNGDKDQDKDDKMLVELRRIGRLCELLHHEFRQERRASQDNAKIASAKISPPVVPASTSQPKAKAKVPSVASRHAFQRTLDGVDDELPNTSQLASRTVGVSTDPEIQSIAIQTVPVRVCSMREIPQHETRLEEAAEAQAAVMSRVEAVLNFQKGLQMRYQNVAGEVIELREDRAEHESRSQELQEELNDSSCEVAAAVNTEIGMFEELCIRRAERDAEALHIAAFREAEMLGAALSEARAEVLSATDRGHHSLKEVSDYKREAEKQRQYALQEEASLRKAKHEISLAKHQIARSALSAKEDAGVKAKAAQATSELQDECEALVLVEGAAHSAESRASEANRELQTAEEQLIDARATLNEAKAEASRERMEVALFISESSNQRLILDEMQDLLRNNRELAFRVESAEAGELWAEISRKEDRDKWLEECQRFQDEARFEVRELGARVHRDKLEQQGWKHHHIHLKEDNEHLHYQIAQLSELLDSSHERYERLHDEQQMEDFASRRGDRSLQRELAAARGREAALLQELERLRHSILDKGPHPGESADVDSQTKATLQEGGNVSLVLSDAEADFSEDGQHRRARRNERYESTKRLQKLLAQERNHREQQRTRATMAEREVASLKDRLQGLETQLRLCKEESERRRAMVSTLQQRCSISMADSKEELEAAREYDEARRSLNLAKREMKSKDALLHEMRQEVSEARQQRVEQRLSEEALTARSEADASRGRAHRAEVQRKDQLLRSARAQVQSLEIQLEEQQRECETRGTKLRRLRATIHNQSSSARKPSPLMISSTAASICNTSEIQDNQELDASDDVSSVSAYTVDIDSTEVRADSESKSPMSHIAPRITMSTLLSSIEETALEESLNILNIDRDDLADFFT